jgi:hypothetical protein
MAAGTALKECPRGQFGPFRKRLELRPLDAGMHTLHERTLRESAVGAGQHVFRTDDARESLQPLGYQFRMLDDIGLVTDHTWYQLASGG